MKHFWALPALLRPSLVLAAHHSFSVHDDLLAFPQFEVKFSEDYVSDTAAEATLHHTDDGQGSGAEVRQYTPTPDGGTGKDEQGGGEKVELEYETMVLDGQKYLCSIPQVRKETETAGSGNDTKTRAEEERELARANDRGWELLAGMQGQCVYFLSGWWSYRFCYGDGVRQFHQLPPARAVPVYPPVEDPGVEGYMLGMSGKGEGEGGKDGKGDKEGGVEENWEGEGALEISEGAKKKGGKGGELVTRGESRYLVQKLEGGTVCDLTGRERRIEVQFHCNPATGSDRITLIKETSTCAYLMVIQTPRLCNDVAFLPPQKDAANAITCRPVLTPAAAEAYSKDLAAHRAALKETDIWASDPDAAVAFGMEHVLPGGASTPQIVGDIIVGARSIVPPEITLEKSAILGGGKETYIDTVADSGGKMLSKEEMKELGLGDPKAVEKLKRELERIAEGEGWKLEVVDTPGGREYRGVIGDEKEGKEGKEGEKAEKAGKAGKKGEGKSEGESSGKGESEKKAAKREEPADEAAGSEEEYYLKEEL